MKIRLIYFLSFLIPATLFCQNSQSVLSPQLVEEGVVSTPMYERDVAISPSGDQLIYTLADFKQKYRCLVRVEKQGEKWVNPTILSFSGEYHDIEPFYSLDGNRLFFASNRPIYGNNARSDFNIWYCDRDKNIWSDPIPLDTIINTKGDEFFPSVSANGNLYFTATKVEGQGKEDIYVSRFEDGIFQKPSPLPSAINTDHYEFNAYVSPDEKLLIFSSYGREDGYGGGDLYLSQKDDTGQWSKAKNVGESINSDKLDYCPFIDWNEQMFYFTSETSPDLDKPIESVNDLNWFAINALNGYGNIYKVPLKILF